MQLTIEKIKNALKKKKYKYYSDRVNIIGIRSNMDVPNIFNDMMVAIYIVPTLIPKNFSVLNKQKFLNSWKFVGMDGKPLKEDGDLGKNTQYAIDQFNLVAGKEVMKIYAWTTDPGTYWMLNPMSDLGTAILKPGQYIDAYRIGYHRNNKKHRALVQTGAKVTVIRDNTKDTKKDKTTEETGYFGINIHGANHGVTTTNINKWSAGCQVAANWWDKEALVDIAGQFKTVTGNYFTYTLLEEADLS